MEPSRFINQFDLTRLCLNINMLMVQQYFYWDVTLGPNNKLHLPVYTICDLLDFDL